MLIDAGISGTTMDRPNLRKLRDLVNTKAIMAAIVYDPDRLSRHLGHQLLLAEELGRTGVKLLIVSHPVEQGPEGGLFFQMRVALAEYEWAKILARLKRGLVGRAKAGHFSDGAVAFGYRYIRAECGGRWEIDGDETAVMRRVFRLCLEGLPTCPVARLDESFNSFQELEVLQLNSRLSRRLSTKRIQSFNSFQELEVLQPSNSSSVGATLSEISSS